MNYLIFTIESSLKEFGRNKIRSFLTALGITIGVFSVVMLIAVGVGFRNYLKDAFEDLGSNLLIVFPGQGIQGGIGQSFSSLASSVRFDENDLRSLSKIGTVSYVVPGFVTTENFESDQEVKKGTLQGVSENFDEVLNLKIKKGRFFDKTQVNSFAKVAVINTTLARKLFSNPDEAVGEYIKAGEIRLQIIGLAEDTGDPEQDNSLMAPYRTLYVSHNPKKEFVSIYLKVDDTSGKSLALAKSQIEKVLKKKYADDEFSVIEPSEILDSLNEIFSVVNYVLIAIGSISLVVGGIGIMNIMYATVLERTKEIGVRRALGATKKDIVIQFLTESTLLSFLGALSGLVLASVVVLVGRNYFPLEINLFAVLISVAVSCFVGIFFGSFPARKASNLYPVDAIRYE